jgi:hypothetical protein
MKEVMEREVKMWQFLAGVIGIIITFSTMIYNRGSMEGKYIERQAISDMKINQQGEEIKELKAMIYQLMQEQNQSNDAMKGSINDIKVLLQNKQDRQ